MFSLQSLSFQSFESVQVLHRENVCYREVTQNLPSLEKVPERPCCGAHGEQPGKDPRQ